MMGFDPFSKLTDQQRTTRIVLLAIILLTLPCYCLGAVLLASAPESPATTSEARSTLSALTASPARSATITPFFTATPTRAGSPLQPTPIQIQFPTQAPIILPTATLTMTPTNTDLPLPTQAPTLTPIPTNTLPPSATPTTQPPPTDAPAPTSAPPTDEPMPTPTQETL
ncbi:MAG TPA: hypothetical protein PKD09_23285 [Aggregatilinea sp.]|uniref:hypothetical protein n=1 Tax=Aggregatilinea sp. TaxID=2806333 RepID=UPI002BE5488C|nr:hypothetical protein [Aggregatilinea sp.]HML24596.1 hypothetical protein [Aggregatilinea sp.]